MNMQLRTGGSNSVAWLSIGGVEVLFVGGVARAFYGTPVPLRRSKIPARIIERYMREEGVLDPVFEPVEDNVFEWRLEEAIVDGLVASDQGGKK